jgi:hypothetical protein
LPDIPRLGEREPETAEGVAVVVVDARIIEFEPRRLTTRAEQRDVEVVIGTGIALVRNPNADIVSRCGCCRRDLSDGHHQHGQQCCYRFHLTFSLWPVSREPTVD